jgi:L-rhamnono-1,4-lactonase
MDRQAVVDSHIHLWPRETANEEGHAWMTPGMPLAKEHLLKDYYAASQQDGSSKSDVEVQGVVYIETDVRQDSRASDIATWAQGPLEEILFVRKVIEGAYGERDSKMLLAFVPWAPMHQPTSVLQEYLVLAKDMAGPKAWPRLKGFRYLLQAIPKQKEFEDLVSSDHFVANLKLLGRRGFSFDIGVDQRSGGSWQLEAIAKAMLLAREGVPEDERVVFIVNHLCKPDFEASPREFDRWSKAMDSIGKSAKTYMKLSGAFSELPSNLTSPKDIAVHMRPWMKHVLMCFGRVRIMFGSDWPVCNLKGPAGESSWVVWKDVVKHILDDEEAYGPIVASDKQRIWIGAAIEAYRIQYSLVIANES